MKSSVDLEYAGLTAPFDVAFGPGMAGPAATSDDDWEEDEDWDDEEEDEDWDEDDDDWDEDDDEDDEEEDWDEEDEEEEDWENETDNVLFESRFLNQIVEDGEAPKQKVRIVREAQPKKDKVTSHRPRKQRVRSPFQSHDSVDDDDE